MNQKLILRQFEENWSLIFISNIPALANGFFLYNKKFPAGWTKSDTDHRKVDCDGVAFNIIRGGKIVEMKFYLFANS